MKKINAIGVALLSLLLSTVFAASSVKPGTVQGVVLDSKGKPVEGATVWIRPVVTTGLAETLTDEKGRYFLDGLPPVGYRAYAWMQVSFRGKTFCQRLASEKVADYNPFNPRDGLIRNFVWKTSGRIPDQEEYSDLGYFGGSFPLMQGFGQERWPTQNDQLELNLTPVGPLIDGSQGKPLTRTASARGYALDVPIAQYRVKATFIGQNGKREAVSVSSFDGDYANEATVDFRPNSSTCKGSTGGGGGRAYVYWKFKN